MTAAFTHESGRSCEVAGFWDGGDPWRVRFAPLAAGTWSWTTTVEPADPGLETVGEVEIEAYAGDNPLWPHGFLRVADDDRHLEHADGIDFFWLGDTAWAASTHDRTGGSRTSTTRPSRGST